MANRIDLDKKATDYLKSAIGGGQGGSTVIANPEGEATEQLNKLQVEDTIYGIPEGNSSLILVNSLPEVGDESLLYKLPNGDIYSCKNKESSDFVTGKTYTVASSVLQSDIANMTKNYTINNLYYLGGYGSFPFLSFEEYDDDSSLIFKIDDNQMALFNFNKNASTSTVINLTLDGLSEAPTVPVSEDFEYFLSQDGISLEDVKPLFIVPTVTTSVWTRLNGGGSDSGVINAGVFTFFDTVRYLTKISTSDTLNISALKDMYIKYGVPMTTPFDARSNGPVFIFIGYYSPEDLYTTGLINIQINYVSCLSKYHCFINESEQELWTDEGVEINTIGDLFTYILEALPNPITFANANIWQEVVGRGVSVSLGVYNADSFNACNPENYYANYSFSMMPVDFYGLVSQ